MPRRKKEKEEIIREKMDMVPDITPAFEKWAMRFVDVHYMRYVPFRKSKETIAICSFCGKKTVFHKGEIVAGEDVKCPNCKVTCKAWRTDWIMKKYVEGMRVQKEVILFQRIKNQFVERHFYATKYIDNDKEKGYLTEISRVFEYKSGMPNGRYFHLHSNWTGEDFWTDKNLCYGAISICSGPVYPRTISNRMFEDTRYKYCAMNELLKNKEEFRPLEWLNQSRKYPTEMELMAKMGLTRLALSVNVYTFQGEGKPWDRLGITKQQLNQLREFNGGYLALKWMREANIRNRKMETDVVKFYEREYIWPENISFIDRKMSDRKIMNYIRAQKKLLKLPTQKVIDLWRDYMSMAKRAKVDTDKELIFKPKDVKKSHDEMIRLLGGAEVAIRAGEIEKSFPDIEKIFAEIKGKYEYENGEFAVIVPEKIEDIIKEGRKLGHCLDKSDIYFDRICRRESYIVFLRRTEDIEKPFYTLEIEPNGTARQKRTVGDKQDDSFKEAVAFIRKWQREVKKRLNKQDKELAKTAEKLRNEEFKELREKQTKVWHGALAGKLLADVLEADLMVANG